MEGQRAAAEGHHDFTSLLPFNLPYTISIGKELNRIRNVSPTVRSRCHPGLVSEF